MNKARFKAQAMLAQEYGKIVKTIKAEGSPAVCASCGTELTVSNTATCDVCGKMICLECAGTILDGTSLCSKCSLAQSDADNEFWSEIFCYA